MGPVSKRNARRSTPKSHTGSNRSGAGRTAAPVVRTGRTGTPIGGRKAGFGLAISESSSRKVQTSHDHGPCVIGKTIQIDHVRLQSKQVCFGRLPGAKARGE